MNSELIDVLDDSGKRVSVTTRGEVHSKNLNFFAVHIWVFDSNGRVLLQLRSPSNSYCPSCWDSSAGGHVSAGEPLEKAAERELKEELCVSVKPGFFARDVLDYNNRRRFVEIFWCKSDGPFEIHSDLAEVKFFRPEEIWEMLETKEFTPGFRMLWEKHGREFEGFVKRLGKPEFIDALDDSGKPISRVTREELHSRKLNFAGTHVWLFNSDKKILLQLRSPKVSFCPSHWDSGAGGHVLAGESVEGAAVREMVEELGVKPVIKLFARETLDFKDGRKRFANVFVGKCDDQFYLNEELDSVKFFSAGEIDAMIESGEKVTPAFKVLWKKFGNDFRREFLT